MKPTRRTQPYRRGGARKPGGALSAMLRGRPFSMPHPMDAHRQMMARRRRRA